MLKRHNQVFFSLLRGADVLLTFLAWELAYRLRFQWVNFPEASYAPSHDAYLLGALVASLATAVSFGGLGVYNTSHVAKIRAEGMALLRGIFGVLVLTLVAAFFYREFSYSRIHVVYFVGVLFVLLLGARGGLRCGLRWMRRRGSFLERVLVIGSGSSAASLLERLGNLRSEGILLAGVIEVKTPEASRVPAHVMRLGGLDKIASVIAQQRIDQVFIALSADEQHRLTELQAVLAEQWVDVRIVPDLGGFRTLHLATEDFEGIPLITVVQSPLEGWNRVLKRTLDLTGASVALLLFGPLMLLVASMVKLTSPGPVLYRQERMGLDGQIFEALKFRSMRVDAESQTGAVWATEDDDRRTPIGALLRKTSLDELPQLFNVLRGEMSLVGPRPERPVFIEQFKSRIPDYMLRHKVKAGITGWAQINGWRGNTSLERRIECDLHYIEHWSLWLDIKILLLTPFKGFIDPNAY